MAKFASDVTDYLYWKSKPIGATATAIATDSTAAAVVDAPDRAGVRRRRLLLLKLVRGGGRRRGAQHAATAAGGSGHHHAVGAQRELPIPDMMNTAIAATQLRVVVVHVAIPCTTTYTGGR